MRRGAKPGKKPSIYLPRKLGKFYDIEKDAPFWLVWQLLEEESKCS